MILKKKDKTIVRHSRRNSNSTIDLDRVDDGLFGVVLNVPVRRYAWALKSRHWIAMRKIGEVWYNLDSDLSDPRIFKDTEDVKRFLDFVTSHGGEVLLVMNKKE
ncbi:unnamed protein product [Dovyalis caffra]|uniref:ubiquitinyl hydrolase 1 n=1 Tax=Dovyalis caffra TaxID=77055 RepID=A0AAV1SDS8_9ROSI|nr:unnamed protein product [Dovyalis caffra]